MGVTITGICIVLTILSFTVYGVKAGLMRAVFGLLSIFFTTVFTWLIYPWVAKLLMGTPLYGLLFDSIHHALLQNDSLVQAMPNFLENLPAFMRSPANMLIQPVHENMISYFAQILSVLAINIISIIILFVGIRLSLMLLKRVGKLLAKLKLIGAFDSLLGGVFGCAQGIIVVYLIIMVISYLPATKVYEAVRDDLQVSMVGKLLYGEEKMIFGFQPRYPK